MSPAPHADRDHSEAPERYDIPDNDAATLKVALLATIGERDAARRETERLRQEIDECWVPLYHGAKAEREAAEAEQDRARSLAATLEARLVEAEATLWDHPDCIGECACAKNAVDAILNPQGDA